MIFDTRTGKGALVISAGVLLGAFTAAPPAQAAPDPDGTDSVSGAQRQAGDTGRSAAGSRGRAPRSAVAEVADTEPAARRGLSTSREVSTPLRLAPDPAPDLAPDIAPELASESAPVPDLAPAPAPEPVGTPALQPAAEPVVNQQPAPSPDPVVGPDPVAHPEFVAEPEPVHVAPRPAAAAASAQPAVLAAAAAPPVGFAASDTAGWGSGTPLQTPLAWAVAAAARNEFELTGQQVSPLGTAEQTAAEQTAARTVHTLPVLAMKAVLGLAWRIIGQIEYGQVGGPDKANLSALSNAVDEWAMGSAFQLMILNSNEPTIVTQVAPPHQWYGVNAPGSRILYDNPDTVYRFVGVNAASEYVITGRLADNDPHASFSVLTGTTGTTIAVLDTDDLELGPDRTFVITVSAAAAQPGQHNHLQITPDTTLIAIRDTLSDWNTEEPMALTIHRTAGPPNSLFAQFGGFAIPGIGPRVAQSAFLTALVSLIPPLPYIPPIVRGSYAALLMLRGITEESKYIKVATTDSVTGNRKAPNVFTDPTSSASFLSTQLQSAGYFQLADDEALVLTIRPNNAGYFVAPVTNDWTITDNYWDQQTSLNNTQAKSNPDGSYTLVVSPTEPTLGEGTSVWNWVSTGGLNQGTMAIRFQSIDPADPNRPTVSSQVVPLSELATVLPAGTPVVTAVARQAQIAARGEGFNRRFAPYPQTV